MSYVLDSLQYWWRTYPFSTSLTTFVGLLALAAVPQFEVRRVHAHAQFATVLQSEISSRLDWVGEKKSERDFRCQAEAAVRIHVLLHQRSIKQIGGDGGVVSKALQKADEYATKLGSETREKIVAESIVRGLARFPSYTEGCEWLSVKHEAQVVDYVGTRARNVLTRQAWTTKPCATIHGNMLVYCAGAEHARGWFDFYKGWW